MARTIPQGVDGTRTPPLCLPALCIPCTTSKLGNCPVLRFKIFALCPPTSQAGVVSRVLPQAGGGPLSCGRATSCRVHMCKLLQLPPAAPDTPPASCPTTTTISSTRHSRPVAYFVLLGLRSLGFCFLCLDDHSSRHCDGNLTVNLLPTLFLCSRLSDKKGCFNRSFYFTGSES